MSDLGMHALLDVERRRVDDQVGPVLLVLAAPDQLRVQVAVAAFVGELDGTLLRLLHERLVLGAGQVLAAGVLVPERIPPSSFLSFSVSPSTCIPRSLNPAGFAVRAGGRGWLPG